MRIPVSVLASDQISLAGIASQLRQRPSLEVTESSGPADATARVAVVACDEVGDDELRLIRGLRQGEERRVVLVVSKLDERAVSAGVGAGVCAFVARQDAHPEHLETVVRAADAGEGSVPPQLLGRLLTRVNELERQVLRPHGLTIDGLKEREIDVLRLVADGFDTAEIAEKLAYSERTVKNVIHDVTVRLNLRNRSHAVAFAVRRGLI